MAKTFSDIPGYTEEWLAAYARVRYGHDSPFTGIGDFLCGVNVRYPTIRDLCVLDLTGNRSLDTGGELPRKDAESLLWRLSRWYRPMPARLACLPLYCLVRYAFMVMVRLRMRNPERLKEVREYMDLCMMDAPISKPTSDPSGKRTIKAPVASIAATLTADLSLCFGGHPESYLDTEAPKAFQWLKVHDKRKGNGVNVMPKMIQEVEFKYARKLQEELDRQREKEAV